MGNRLGYRNYRYVGPMFLTSSLPPRPTAPPVDLTSSSAPGPSAASAVLTSPLPPGPSSASAVLTSSSAPGPSASTVLTSSSPAGPSTASSTLTGHSPSLLAGSGSSLQITDNQKRWVVVGIGMHLVLLPALLDVVRQEICQFYIWLKSSKAIDTQVFGAHMKNDGSFPFYYASINNNQKGKTPKMYDYRVTSAEDLGKLYLQPHMAKFTGFDNTCDLSAVLGILANASVFETSLQGNARNVRSQVRNEWGHCNFDHWGELEYTNCFTLMKTLVSSLKLPTGDKKKIRYDLLEWEVNGLQLCIDGPLNKDLVKLVSDQVANLECGVNLLRESSADEAKNISDTLQKVRCEFDKHLADLREQVEEQNKLFSNAIRDMSMDISQLKCRHDDLEARHNDVEATLGSIKDNHDICNVTNSAKAVAFQVPSRNPYFCGRDRELGAIRSHLQVTESQSCALSAICGLGGVGKTSLTVEFLWRHKEEYKGGIFWISGESNTLFENSFCELARKLGTFVEKDFPSTLPKTLDRLQRQSQLWCLVVDNLDEPFLSQGLRELLRGKWKQQAHGHIIVTTRREARQAAEVAGIEEQCCVGLDCLTEEDSIQFLRRRTEKNEGEDSEVRETIELLGALPLALDQAAAYIRCVRCSLKDYVKQYKEQKLLLLKRKEARDVEEFTSRERLAVHTTWLMNFEHIKSNPSYEKNVRQATNLVMEVSAFLCPDEIPFEVINEGLPPIDNESGIADVLRDSLGRHEIISLLTEFSLFQRCGTDSFRVHRLVQEVIRARLDKEREKLVLTCAKRFLACSTPLSEKARLALNKNKFYIDWREFSNKLDEASNLCTILGDKNQEGENACLNGEKKEKKRDRKSWLFRKFERRKTEGKQAPPVELEVDTRPSRPLPLLFPLRCCYYCVAGHI